MNPKKKAKKVKPENREKEAFKYINKATKKQKEAAEKLGTTIDDFNKTIKETVQSADVSPQEQHVLASVVTQVNKLLSEARKGGDIDKIVSKLKKLK